jgi:arylsulfatase A-like enzyme
MDRPNVLLIMTDEERYPTPYETAEVTEFRRSQLTSRERIRDGGVELHRHYVGSTACVPSRATFFTGQYPSLHGVSQTDGVAKHPDDPAMHWLDPDEVPTLGDWFRAGGYQTHYRGKWHVSHADLPMPGTHEGLAACDDDGRPIPEVVEAYRRADRLDPFGFSGWIGREPHGAAKKDCGTVRDGIFAEQVTDLFADLGQSTSEGPWLAVASFVNPHDIAFAGGFYELLLGFELDDDTVPDIAAAPSQSDSFAGRPACQELFKDLWPELVAPQAADNAYRRLYYYLHKLVDQAVGRILDALEASGMADDTIVVFTSDHGDLLGAHGGMQQKWANAYDEAVRVPMLVKGPGIAAAPGGLHVPTSHVDVIPTLLGLAGIDVERATDGVSRRHTEARPLPGRDLSAVLTGRATPESIATPVYFMTEDAITSGLTQQNVLTGEPFESLPPPACIESVVTTLPTGADGADQLWKLNHYYERLDEWNAEHGIVPPAGAGPLAEPAWELHNLTADPEERHNRAGDAADVLSRMQSVLEQQRDAKRLVPDLRHGEPGHRAWR